MRREQKSNTCLQSWCCGFPSVFVPSFLQMEGRVRLQGLSSQRPSCARKQDTNRERERERTQLFSIYRRRTLADSQCPLLWGWLRPQTSGVSVRAEGVTHSSPDGDAILLSVAEVVGFKRVPVGEDDGRVVGPLEVHLHISVVEADPQLVNVWQKTQANHRVRKTTEGEFRCVQMISYSSKYLVLAQ